MPFESTFAGSSDSPIDPVAAWYAGDPLFQGILDSPLPSYVHPFAISGFPSIYFSEIPSDTPRAPGVAQDILHFNQTPYEASIFQPQTTTAPLNASSDEVTEAEVWYTDFTQLSGGVLPIHSLPAPSSPPATAFPLNCIRVPQRNYDHGRKQRNFKRLEPIYFSVGGRLGVNMGDAFRKIFTSLDGYNDPVLTDAAGAISCRLLFPGYPDNGRSCQISALGCTRDRLPITRSKLAYEVAKKLKRYLDSMTGYPIEKSADKQWKIGEGSMRLADMFLVSLESVSKGSFQPEIWVIDS